MARDVNGNYTLPLPDVITGDTIEASWANTTLADLEAEMTDSLSRSGSGGMQTALELVDGNVSAPGWGFNSEANTGFYRAAAGDMRITLLGSDAFRVTSTGVQVWDGAAWASPVINTSSGRVNNDTLRWDAASGEWLGSSNVTHSAAGDIVAAGSVTTDTIKTTGPPSGLTVEDDTLTLGNGTQPGGVIQFDTSLAGPVQAFMQVGASQYRVEVGSDPLTYDITAGTTNIWSLQTATGNVTMAGTLTCPEITQVNTGRIQAVDDAVQQGVGVTIEGDAVTNGAGSGIVVSQDNGVSIVGGSGTLNWSNAGGQIVNGTGGQLKIGPPGASETLFGFSTDEDLAGDMLARFFWEQTSRADNGDGRFVSTGRIETYEWFEIRGNSTPAGTEQGVLQLYQESDELWVQNRLGVKEQISSDVGTFTPTIQDVSGSDAEGQTYSVQDGHYVKQGPLVFFTLRVTTTSLGTLSGALRIAGLPYTSSATVGKGRGHFVCHAGTMSLPADQSIYGLLGDNSNHILLILATGGSGSSSATPTEVTDTAVLEMSGTYITDS